jgi:hypothetical protein
VANSFQFVKKIKKPRIKGEKTEKSGGNFVPARKKLN